MQLSQLSPKAKTLALLRLERERRTREKKSAASQASATDAQKQAAALVATHFGFRGAALEIQSLDAPEVMLSGPFEVGKTVATLTRFHRLLCEYPGARMVMLKKTFESAITSVVRTFQDRILPKDGGGVITYGGKKPRLFEYPNGSEFWVGGLDDAQKTLSTEWDGILVNQAEELTAAEWEILTSRATGRAGHMPFGQVIGDCNPGGSTHWIRKRTELGHLLLKEMIHKDNPRLYDDDGNITPEGERTMLVLNRMTGVRLLRYRDGLWVNAEGAVYSEYNPTIHLLDYNSEQFPYAEIPKSWRRVLSIDFGFTNPFVCQDWAIDPDGRMYLVREIYHTQRTVKEHSKTINEWRKRFRYPPAAADHDAEDRATLRENGIATTAAKKDISTGIEKVQERFKIQKDGKPRIFFFRNSVVDLDEDLSEAKQPVSTIEELDLYVYPKGGDGKPVKENPVDMYNHGMDAMRYAVMRAEFPTGDLFYE